jgi:hypothetical protein
MAIFWTFGMFRGGWIGGEQKRQICGYEHLSDKNGGRKRDLQVAGQLSSAT